MRAPGVAGAGEGVEQGLKVREGGGLARLGAEPVLHGLLEPLGLALGLGVVRLAVLLGDAESAQLVLQGVAAAPAACEAGGEDHAAVGQGAVLLTAARKASRGTRPCLRSWTASLSLRPRPRHGPARAAAGRAGLATRGPVMYFPYGKYMMEEP